MRRNLYSGEMAWATPNDATQSVPPTRAPNPPIRVNLEPGMTDLPTLVPSYDQSANHPAPRSAETAPVSFGLGGQIDWQFPVQPRAARSLPEGARRSAARLFPGSVQEPVRRRSIVGNSRHGLSQGRSARSSSGCSQRVHIRALDLVIWQPERPVAPFSSLSGGGNRGCILDTRPIRSYSLLMDFLEGF